MVQVVVTATKNPTAVQRWLGDDWQFEVAYQNPDGSAFDMTGYECGAEFYPDASSEGIDLESGLGETSILSPPTDGLCYAVVYRAITLNIVPDASAKLAGKTRIQVYLIDPNGLKGTILVQPIWVRQE